MRVKWNTELVKKEMEKDNYKLLSEYKNNSCKLIIQCDKGHTYEASWSNYKNRGSRCPYCCHNHTINLKYIKNFAEKEGYKILSTSYINAYKELTFECSHGHIFDLVWCYFQSGTRCPYCKISKGEEQISKTLLKYNIDNIREKTFEDCIYKSKLRFDFYLPQYNVCIEYDGKQHFEPQDFSGHGNSEEEFKETKIRDNIKDKYCKDNNIKLIRIPYFEFDNIENILKQELNLIKTFND